MKNKIRYILVLPLFYFVFSSCKKQNLDDIITATINNGPHIYYVSDPNGVDSNNGASAATPFKTITKALPYVQPGDTVYLMTGTFSITSAINITSSGKPNKYITFKAMPGNSPVIYASGNNYNAMVINGSYIQIQGIEFKGDNANLNYSAALASYNTAAAGGALTGVYNTNAITIGGSGTSSLFPTHVKISNCLVHDFPGGGITAIQADYVTIQNNTVYNNCWYTIYAPSGISILNPFDSDNVTTYKNVVSGNMVYNNKTTIPWITTKALSDGNGIIIDVNIRPYTGTGPAYNGRTLVQNNISVNNGGGGVHAFMAGHVDIINNTAYNNGQVVGYPDIDAQGCNDVEIISNIMYARNGGRAQDNLNSTNFTVDYNVYYNGTNATTGPHDKIANPLFINLSTDLTMANFQLQQTSPAVNSGSPTIFSPIDILGVTRPKGTAPDCGAYESF